MKRILIVSGIIGLAACSEATSPTRLDTGHLKPTAALAAGNTTEIVREGDISRQVEGTAPLSSWTFYVRNGGSGAFVDGPATAPFGAGSFQISTPAAADKAYLFNYSHVGTTLASIDAISYKTYQVTPNPVEGRQIPALNMEIDFNGPDAGGFTTLVFEPVYNTGQGAVTSGMWQSWDAFAAGNAIWWSSRAIPGVCASDCYVFWNTIVAANPQATILGGFGINQGSGNASLVGAVDALVLGYAGNSVTYDFEPEPDLTCYFTTAGSTMTLNGDCETSTTISIPDGFTIDGAGHTITAVDPDGGHFLGAVITNGGVSASVINLILTARDLADVCDADDDRLRGILFDGAAGSISNNTVSGVRQGLSGCQEGNAIEVRNEPFDSKTSPTHAVTISGNTVSNYQKNGITANGSVSATITGNVVTGDGPIEYTAQNGIQVAFGATAIVKNNTVSGNNYTPASYVACGFLIFEAGGVKASANTLFANERDQCNFGKGGGKFNESR